MSAPTGTAPDSKGRSLAKSAATLIPTCGRRMEQRSAGGCTPPVLTRASGAKVIDADGRDFVDMDLAGGSLLLGHADERVVVAIDKAATKGWVLDSPCEAEVRLAEMIASRFAHVDRVEFRTDPSDAVQDAIRIARLATGRKSVLTLAGWCGCGSLAESETVVEYNDLPGLRRAFHAEAGSLAAVVIEPVSCSFGLVPAEIPFLQGIRQLCDEHGVILLYDERRTNVRAALGGCAERTGVAPDLAVLGGALSAGLCLAVIGGRKSVMTMAPQNQDGWPVSIGARPVDMLSFAATTATLQTVAEPDFLPAVEAKAVRLAEGLSAAAAETGLHIYQTRVGSMLGLFFADQPIGNARQAETAAPPASFSAAMLAEGVLWPSNASGPIYVSAAHEDADLDRVIAAARAAFAAHRESG